MTEAIREVTLDLNDDSPDLIGAGKTQTFDFPIGGEGGLKMRVTVNGGLVPVLSSTWRMQGQMIVQDSVRQTREEGKFRITSAPTLNGGYDGDPAAITAAWLDEGVFEFNVNGKYRWKGGAKNYSHRAYVNVHAPVLTLPKGGLGSPDADIRSDRMLINYGTGALKYTCDRSTAGGKIGFLQLLKGRYFRGRISDCQAGSPETGTIEQSLGAQSEYLDDATGKGDLFYWHTKAGSAGELQTEIERSLLCEGFPKYNWYKAGLFPSLLQKAEERQPLEFFTHVAYQAPVDDDIYKSYIVTKGLLYWYVSAAACSKPRNAQAEWRMPGSQYLSVGSWEARKWGMPEWKDGSTGMHWKDA
jgi:hypothetical protein